MQSSFEDCFLGGNKMINVYGGKLYVGNQNDLYGLSDDFNIVHAAKEPFHRSLIGFQGSKCPEDKYFYEDDKRCSLCIIDFPKEFQWGWFPEDMLKSTMEFIDKSLADGKNVLIHCNQGMSRAPSIAFMYLVSRGLMKEDTFENNLKYFIELYPEYRPATAIFTNVKRKYPFDYLKKE